MIKYLLDNDENIKDKLLKLSFREIRLNQKNYQFTYIVVKQKRIGRITFERPKEIVD